MPSQRLDLEGCIEQSSFRIADFRLENGQTPTIKFGQSGYVFAIHDKGSNQGYMLRMVPGPQQLKHEAHADRWDQGNSESTVLFFFREWLDSVRRQRAVLEGTGVEGPAPEWALGELPAKFDEVRAQLKDLTEERERLESMARLLWQTGTPLEEAVRDTFRAMGFTAELTDPGTTYDVRVRVADEQRLLLEVTGVKGGVGKSRKITQVVDTLQGEATDGDRIVLALAANTHRNLPAADRLSKEAITKDALRILQGLRANFVTTTTLFEIWKLSQADKPAARERLLVLHSQDGGHFT